MIEEKKEQEIFRLTQFSHGAGCGCKISPSVLNIILKDNESRPDFKNLLVGNHSRDDAAVLDLGNGQALISTTDFFMPIVDDPFDFGRIAATNAISDVYAMGGTPVLAIAILGWPVDKIPADVAAKVIAGGRAVCEAAGIALAGGHSIDSPEPIFGLSVNGMVAVENLKKNNTAKEGDIIFLTKQLGIGILSTAAKQGFLKKEDELIAIESMTTLNIAGAELSKLKGVHAITDVTGFGLLGHLSEMAEGSKLSAEISMSNIPVIPSVQYYINKGCIPGGTTRNLNSYGTHVSFHDEYARNILSDPQTSGGLLVAVAPSAVDDYKKIISDLGLDEYAKIPIGVFTKPGKFLITVAE